MGFLIDRLKETFKPEDDYEETGFPDLNFQVGNTTGKDIGGEPAVLHRRVGRFAQLGGEVMEVLIDNPATFQVEREGLLNVLQQLGVDASWHGDANMGFCAAYATRAQGVNYGFNLAHRYFTRYLEQLASFKQTVDQLEGYDFSVEYVNMHASTAQAPALEEQIPSDKVMDPFGNPLSNVTDDKEKNIYRNRDFMEHILDFLLIPYVRDVSVYQSLAQINEDFEREWQGAQEDILDNEWSKLEGRTVTKAAVIQNSVRVDEEIGYMFNTLAEEETLDEEIEDENQQGSFLENIEDVFNLRRLVKNVKQVEQDQRIQKGGELSNLSYNLEGHSEEILDKLENVLNKLWNDEDGLNFQAKQSALVNTVEYLSQENILEEAADDERIKQDARKVLAGKGDYEFGDEENCAKQFQDFIDKTRAGRQVEREMEKESTAYYRLLPLWMKYADQNYGEEHPGWEDVKFIWDTIVGDKYGEDLLTTEGKPEEKFRDKLSDDKNFRSDITAAVGATYLWGHFTQVETDFESDKPRGPEEWENDIEEWTSDHGDWTWAEYMNSYGLTVNIESMYGDPSNILRLWRPKDISVACRAVNRTARRLFEKEWDQEEYRGPICKFTIDLEHTASFGVDPEREMEIFFEQEKKLAEEGETDSDPEKPVSDILKTYHLTKPGFEQTGGVGHRHGPFARGDTTLYRYLYKLVEAGFCRDEDEGIVMFEIGGDYSEEMYMIRIAMDMIRLGIHPREVSVDRVDPEGGYEDEEEALIARFFGLDEPNVDREWAKIEEHAFDPLKGLLEAEEFDYTYSSSAALENENRPGEWQSEEYR